MRRRGTQIAALLATFAALGVGGCGGDGEPSASGHDGAAPARGFSEDATAPLPPSGEKALRLADQLLDFEKRHYEWYTAELEALSERLAALKREIEAMQGAVEIGDVERLRELMSQYERTTDEIKAKSLVLEQFNKIITQVNGNLDTAIQRMQVVIDRRAS